jgi:hypothetical protein
MFPKSVLLNKSDSDINLIVHGQGVFIFDNHSNACSFRILTNDKKDGYVVSYTPQNIIVDRINMSSPLIDPNNKIGLSSKNGAYYWFSIDSQNQTFRAGIGEARIETQNYFYQLSHSDKLFLESLTSIQCLPIQPILPSRLLRDPITLKVPLVVKKTKELTMHHIASSQFLPKANLSSISQILYECIAGENFTLDDSDFPEFTQAIEHSIATKGCWCNKRLEEKSTEFNKDKPNILETYLRITLGQNNGESPGIPYVMEIWPKGHFSPVHSHAGANAVIRVLNGTININLYPFLCNDKTGVDPFSNVNLGKDEITWISTNLNQIHQLKNLETSKDTCITIQCYMYDQNNNFHYDYFDYIDDDGKKQQYEPDSDMDFIEFKKLMKREWSEFMNTVKTCKWCCF